MEGYTRFSDVRVGSKFPEQPLKFVVSPDQVAAFLDATDGGPIDGDHAKGTARHIFKRKSTVAVRSRLRRNDLVR